MNTPLKGACIFGQSGGPSSVINASAYGVIKTALDSEYITKVYGANHGIKGVLEDRLLVMDEGEIVANGTPASLKARISGDVVTIDLAKEDQEKATGAVRHAVELRDVATTDNSLLVTVEEGGVAVAPILRSLDDAGIAFGSISVNRPSLDDVFLTLTGRSLREAA